MVLSRNDPSSFAAEEYPADNDRRPFFFIVRSEADEHRYPF